MFDWDHLRHFAALADEGSLSAAARRLKVEHATVSRRVAALEEAVGARLVDRRAGRYVLTPEGERMAEAARRMEAEAFAIERAMRGGQADLSGEVSISAPPVVAALKIAPRLGDLRTRHPALRLHLVGESRNVSLTRREADVAVRLSRPNDDALVARRIGVMRYAAFAAAAYLAAWPAEDWHFIAFDESLDHVPQQAWLKELAGERPIVLRTNDLAIQIAAAQAQVGVAVLPSFAGEAHGLTAIEVPGSGCERDVWLTYHSDLRGNAAVAAVVAYLADCFAAQT